MKLMTNFLKSKANQIRIDAIKLALEHKDSHIVSSFSTIEILVALYYNFMKENDQFILSKGHGVIGFYSILKDKGLNPTISGHPDMENDQGIVCTTGSLGHGLALGVGKALAKKIKKESGTIYVLVGDGECQEGIIWESCNIIRKYHLNNIVIIVDNNKLQALSSIEDIMHENNLKGKFEAFGLNTVEIDGHNFEEIKKALSPLASCLLPKVILANTVKGKGISFIENKAEWHSRMLEGEQYDQAIRELEGNIN